MSLSASFTLFIQRIVIRYTPPQTSSFADNFANNEDCDQTLLRAELFSADQMDQHSKSLANSHVLGKLNSQDKLLKRLDENEQILIKTCGTLTMSVKAKMRISPSGEWLLDNFYLIENQIRIAKKHLPKGYSRELPILAQGPSSGLPRVYDLALEVISHGDGRIDGETLNRFVEAYQTITPLMIGELWAIPIMLRLALIENLRRVSMRITHSKLLLSQAQSWAAQMMATLENDPKNLILVVADMARSNPPMASSFIAELARCLQGHGTALSMPLNWIEQRLAEMNITIEQMIRLENQQQAADQVSVSNTIGSLRFLSAMDWRTFVERMSFVETILREDQSRHYINMDFASRDRYRHVIAKLASKSALSEIDVAREAIKLSNQSAKINGVDHYTAHVGFYLIEEGLPILENIITPHPSLISSITGLITRFPLALYLSTSLLMTVMIASGLLAHLHDENIVGWRFILLSFLSLLAASQLALSLVNWLATLWVKPQRLPRMDFSEGIPERMCTLVVIPTLIAKKQNIDDLLETLEVHFLGNQDEQLHFALLTDFHDAREETIETDAPLLAALEEGITALNQKYCPTKNNRFFLFHRPRRWNPSEKSWMGYERKRGKLEELNALLRNRSYDSFSLIVGDIKKLSRIKYVITLDTDTQLPRTAAHQLVGAMAHPLNRARYDQKTKRISGGYGILQPNIAESLSGPTSYYRQLCGTEPGIDPYTRSISDVYQDLFCEGSFIGKGIYDIDAFEQVLNGQLPTNQVLSHDLLEGCYVRSGLISDIHLYEEYPARYTADVSRRKRWIRGDWQTAPWLLPWVLGANRKPVKNPLSALSRWKIFDNLRRSLLPGALVLLVILGWLITQTPWFWTFSLIALFITPSLLMSFVDAFNKPKEIQLYQHGLNLMRIMTLNLARAGLRIVCLSHEAVFSLEAMTRSLWRMFYTRRRLLEWHAYGEQNQQSTTQLKSFCRLMWPTLAISSFAIIGFAIVKPTALPAALPILLLWLTSPAMMWWLSLPPAINEGNLTTSQQLFLKKIALKTWGFFEAFVVEQDNWLPPDNFQHIPGPTIAHRTSPTNIGLSLLANLSAYDFGFISITNLLQRTTNTFNSMAQLERYEGHFYNWYDTQSMRPLSPRYISSVDSGNLAGHLLTLRAGLLALPDHKIVGTRLFESLLDTLNLIQSCPIEKTSAPSVQAQLSRIETVLRSACVTPPVTIEAIIQQLELTLTIIATMPEAFYTTPINEAIKWTHMLKKQCNEIRDDLKLLVPWLFSSSNIHTAKQLNYFDKVFTFNELAQQQQKLLTTINEQLKNSPLPDEESQLNALAQQVIKGQSYTQERIKQIDYLVTQATDFSTVSYAFLYDHSRHLMSIGFNVDELRLDASFYDLLASEARLCSFVGISQGKLPQESWFALGRLLTSVEGKPVLMSWDGSMFEYLMPLLIMPTYKGTLLDQTYKTAVMQQIAFGKQHSLPWGISESGYNTVDASLNYQYHAFGVPNLRLRRSLSEDLIVAPYASALALMVFPEAACENLQQLAKIGLEGEFGFYEAIDYTASRASCGESCVIVRSFMAHHQGMTLLSIGHLLLNQPMQKRFESDPLFQASLLLLQERIPKTAVAHTRFTEQAESSHFEDNIAFSNHPPLGANTPTPEVQLLSNGRYHVMITNAGGGYSRWQDTAIGRWREDATCDNWGSFIYLRDSASGEFWSATHQPTLKKAISYEAIFSEWRAEFRRHDQEYETYTQVIISPEDDIELRRLRITNRSQSQKTIELTTYAEVVLASQASDMMQPSFGNLFVQTEIMPEYHAILCTRRPRSLGEKTPWMFHLITAHGADINEISYETDRMQFIGRGNTLVAPRVMTNVTSLSGSEGSVLDPIVSIRCYITLETQKYANIDIICGMADSKDACLLMIEKYQDRHFADRIFELACTHGSLMLRQINASETETYLYRRLANSIVYANASLRADSGLLVQNRRGQSSLWGYAISGDLPIILLKISDSTNIELAKQLIQCHTYWRLKGLSSDLVIWNEDQAGYRQNLHDQIMGLITTGAEAHAIDRPGGIFVRSAEQISKGDRILLQAVARIIITDNLGTLAEQINRRTLHDKRIARLIPAIMPQTMPKPSVNDTSASDTSKHDELILANHLGGFTPDGREYVIKSSQGKMTPLPWVNVIANPLLGTVISESGLAYTWSENAHEFRLTPWKEDTIGSVGGEIFYLRDEKSGHFWSPTLQPCGGNTPYITRHGFGYSVFEHTEEGIYSELWVYVDLEEAIKFCVLKVKNISSSKRQLSVTGYIEWVLGDLAPKSAMHIVTEIDENSGALLARNPYNTEFAKYVAFFDAEDPARTISGDRAEFIGRNGTLKNPAAMSRLRLSGRTGAGLDPCGAIQIPFELEQGKTREIVFRLGVGSELNQTITLARKRRATGSAQIALEKVHQYWKQTLGILQIETPDPALNVLTNGWLVYQILACRIWARSGFYQSGGAFGFRDQLQDVMALVHAKPSLMREHLLRCATRQFPEGDVQHWWHPPFGRGVRTRCSDDYLWLPLATHRYIVTTGDTGVLDENASFLESRKLNADEESYYDLPGQCTESASLYQHCVRAILHGLRFGDHGLPLMGSGDWNDGMNLVGEHGKGESVWLGFFLYEVLTSFAKIAQLRGDVPFFERCQKEAAQLQLNLRQHGWDGEWYLRAFFDDGSPLGSSTNAECMIDSISQSWSVLSGGGDIERAHIAMNSLDKHLVRRNEGLVQLLDPPFDKSNLNPGYIKGYVPGVRENGGQYTHAAVWAAMAFAALDDNVRAWTLLDIINPLNHGLTKERVNLYKTEPYVVAADVYGAPPHTGRGGWTWYTGSAGWLYRLITESLLGLKREGNDLQILPCLPDHWTKYTLHYRYEETTYQITVIQTHVESATSITMILDGIKQKSERINLVNDYRTHVVEVNIAKSFKSTVIPPKNK